MEKTNIEELILEYLKEDLSSEQREKLVKALKQAGYTENDISELESVKSHLKEFVVPEPGEGMDHRFYSMLNEHKQVAQERARKRERARSLFKSVFPQKYLPQVAYSLVLFALGWSVRTWLVPDSRTNNQMTQMSEEIREMREMVMLSLIDESSVTKRIKAVNIANNFNQVDDKIIQALLTTLNNDPNENVRVITAETLHEFADNPKVREGLIRSIVHQESPLVQIALADIMISMNEKRSVDSFRELLTKKDLNDTVRARIERTIQVLI